LSAGLTLACLRRPRRLPAVVGATSAAAAVVTAAARRPRGDVATVATLAPVWAVAFGAGLWRGLGMLLARRFRGRSA
jgi:hypothetical protein